MDISSILVEPNSAGIPIQIVSNYRQIRFVVEADSVVGPIQPMYADIYFINPLDGLGLLYYKTMASYSIEANSTGSLFMFDIQDAAQEYLQTYIPEIQNSAQQSDATRPYSDIGCVVRFRGSTITAGILTPNPTVPAQGTATTPPISGTGTACNQFYILNSTIPADFEIIYNNNLESVLLEHQVIGASFLSDTAIYPLSNLPKNPFVNPNLGLCNAQWRNFNGAFPIFINRFGISGILDRYSRSCSIWLIYGTNGVMSNFIQIATPFAFGANTYYLPSGLKEIKALIPSGIYDSLILPANNNYYRIGLYDEDGAAWCFYSPLFSVYPTAPDGSQCLWFQNNYGHFEQVTFVKSVTKLNVQSSETFVPYAESLAYSIPSTNPLNLGRRRYNTRSSDELTLNVTVQEQLLPWLRELFRSPYVLQQIPSMGGEIAFYSGFRAVKILDDSFTIKEVREDAGIKYMVTMRIRPAIDDINLR